MRRRCLIDIAEMSRGRTAARIVFQFEPSKVCGRLVFAIVTLREHRQLFVGRHMRTLSTSHFGLWQVCVQKEIQASFCRSILVCVLVLSTVSLCLGVLVLIFTISTKAVIRFLQVMTSRSGFGSLRSNDFLIRWVKKCEGFFSSEASAKRRCCSR